MVGVDEETLKQIGYNSMTAFLQEHDDVADLFVKKPGYVHNFQNFSWIDFVRHADAEETKAIVLNGSKQFSCLLGVSTFFLSDNPDKEAFAVTFKHIRSLNDDTAQESVVEPDHSFTTVESEIPISELPAPELEDTEQTILEEPDLFDIPDLPPVSIPDINPDGSLNIPLEIEKPSQEETLKSKPMLGDYINAEEKAYIDSLQTEDSYTYDPHIAADELGLPVELISEFIGDFIQQANEFKTPLFDAALKEDFDEVHLLSHKLKGVAANLRVEDAFEVLSNVNTSHDQVEIEANLKQFYRIIAKMEGKEAPDLPLFETPSDTKNPEPAPLAEDDDIYDLGFTLEDPSNTVSLQENIADDTAYADTQAGSETSDTEDFEFLNDTDSFDIPADLVQSNEDIETAETKDANHAVSAEPLHYDLQKAALELDLKADFVSELCKEFKQNTLDSKEALYAAIGAGDTKKVQSIAFEFKGLADNLRIEQISKSLQNLLSAPTTDEADRLYALLEQL